MKIIIAGSRDITEYADVWEAFIHSPFSDTATEIVSGGARGPDTLGIRIAAEGGLGTKLFPANWEKFGKTAGIIRNCEMAVYADGLVAVWDGKSKGTLHMINDMVSKKKPVFVYCPV